MKRKRGQKEKEGAWDKGASRVSRDRGRGRVRNRGGWGKIFHLKRRPKYLVEILDKEGQCSGEGLQKKTASHTKNDANGRKTDGPYVNSIQQPQWGRGT